ncbi:DNA gyrase subunit B [Chimaeribacter californicus]|uniref:DNA gyrase subunit B n=1 Tax=Chimaeribacter californicus TaxID=2060067 RepID=A0A2N5E782_9GAMM|nr:hypothetical protein [Chimaeribacter californicus]PLR37341.1 DNA gyrase subunit B [Chimaeribacter californicus]
MRLIFTALQGVGWLTTLAWPFLVWFSLTHPGYRALLPLLACLFLVRALACVGRREVMKGLTMGLALAGCLLSAASLLLGRAHLLLWYPVVVNVALLALFGGSLLTAMPLVERLARLRQPYLPPEAVRYTRRVTQVWCGFFMINGSVALATCLRGHLNEWTLWNGAISYLLMGILMGGEWLVRRRVQAAS